MSPCYVLLRPRLYLSLLLSSFPCRSCFHLIFIFCPVTSFSCRFDGFLVPNISLSHPHFLFVCLAPFDLHFCPRTQSSSCMSYCIFVSIIDLFRPRLHECFVTLMSPFYELLHPCLHVCLFYRLLNICFVVSLISFHFKLIKLFILITGKYYQIE